MRIISKFFSLKSVSITLHEVKKIIHSAVLLHKIREMSSKTQGMLSKEELAAMRISYKSQGLKFDEVEKKEPFSMFDRWFKVAKECTLIREPNAMSLATVSSDGKPSIRVVLLKGYDESGFRFFTNYRSRKGREMENNPNVAILFYWEPLEQQIRIKGKVEKLTEDESLSYFQGRPRASQLGALASNQSSPIPSKQFLEQRYAELDKKYENSDVPKPESWGGYQLKPELFEFWCGGKGRMHDRVVFKKQTSEQSNEYVNVGDDGWSYEFIAP